MFNKGNLRREREKNRRCNPFSATFFVVAVCFILAVLPQVSGIVWDNIDYYKLDDDAADTIIINEVGTNGIKFGGNTEDDDVPGKINLAQNFSVTPDYVQLANTTNGVFSFSLWFNTTDTSSQIITKWTGVADQRWALTYNVGTNKLDWFENAAVSINYVIVGGWHHVVVAVDSANWTVWIDGASRGTGTFAYSNKNYPVGIAGYSSGNTSTYRGAIDEVGIWDRILNEADVVDLYNGGNGLAFGGTPAVITITLENPLNDSTVAVTTINFTASGNVTSDFNATNITYYIWNATDDTIFNQTLVALSGTQADFNQSLFIENFIFGDYIWNIKICYENSTFNNCTFGTNNYTFSIVPISTIAESYSPVVLEGDASLFTINLSIITTDRLTSAAFVYNGTSFPASATEYATNTWFLSYTHNIPEVDTNSNVTFYWSIKLESGFISNSTSHNQTIVQIAIDDCSVYTIQIFNFSLVDEKNQSVLNGVSENTSIKIDMSLSYTDSSGEIIQFFQNYTEINPARVCMEAAVGNSTLRMDAIIEYSSLDRFVEFYNIQNFTFNNVTENRNITLYNLREDEGQEFKITYKGQDFIPIPNLIIQIQRKYIEEGVFKTIEIPMSGSNGYTIAHLVPNDIIYNLAFIKNGDVLDLFTNVIANCQNPAITECEINLNALITGNNLINIVTESDFFSSLTFNKTTRVVSATFGITSGVSSVVQLNVTLVDNFGNQTVCSDSLDAAGGTLTCTVPNSFGNSTIYATIIYDGEIRRQGFISLKQSPKEQYAGVIIFSSIILLMFVFGIGISDSPMITGVFLILGAMLLIGLNLAYTTSWVGAGATILWFIVAVVIVIIKGGSKR